MTSRSSRHERSPPSEMTRVQFSTMNSSSPAASSTERYSHRLADIVGTAIALLTLTLPLFVIANYSTNNRQSNITPITYPVKTTPDD